MTDVRFLMKQSLFSFLSASLPFFLFLWTKNYLGMFVVVVVSVTPALIATSLMMPFRKNFIGIILFRSLVFIFCILVNVPTILLGISLSSAYVLLIAFYTQLWRVQVPRLMENPLTSTFLEMLLDGLVFAKDVQTKLELIHEDTNKLVEVTKETGVIDVDTEAKQTVYIISSSYYRKKIADEFARNQDEN